MPYVPSDDQRDALIAEMQTPEFQADMETLAAAEAVPDVMDVLPETPPRPTALDMLRQAAAAAGVDPDEIVEAAADPDVIPPDEYEVQRQEAAAERKRLATTACATCGEPIDGRDRNVLREVRGWSADRQQGGQNHVIAREETGRVMCGECATRMRAGLTPGQESLL